MCWRLIFLIKISTLYASLLPLPFEQYISKVSTLENKKRIEKEKKISSNFTYKLKSNCSKIFRIFHFSPRYIVHWNKLGVNENVLVAPKTEIMIRIAFQLTFVAAVVIYLCAAQVNFSPYWNQGKRSAGSLSITPEECKSPMDSLIYLYKLIQSEAQKIVDCEKISS